MKESNKVEHLQNAAEPFCVLINRRALRAAHVLARIIREGIVSAQSLVQGGL